MPAGSSGKRKPEPALRRRAQDNGLANGAAYLLSVSVTCFTIFTLQVQRLFCKTALRCPFNIRSSVLSFFRWKCRNKGVLYKYSVEAE